MRTKDAGRVETQFAGYSQTAGANLAMGASPSGPSTGSMGREQPGAFGTRNASRSLYSRRGGRDLYPHESR
jgi:hypothetical protein